MLRSTQFRAVLVGAGALTMLWVSAPSSAADPDPVSSARAAISSGDLRQALRIAESAGARESDQHDAILAEVARAQTAAGDRQAAIATASQIDDDRTLADTLSAVRVDKAGPMAGGVQADFGPLIDLIQATVGPGTWTDVGGLASIMGFDGGVFVAPDGVLRSRIRLSSDNALGQVRLAAAQQFVANADIAQGTAKLRKVSLTRLERQLQLRAAQGLSPTPEMQTLAGLVRVEYVLAYPEQGELVLVGTADDCQAGVDGRLVGRATGRPPLRLDDLIVVLRQIISRPDARFGCSITPTREGLANVNAFLAEQGGGPLKPGQLEKWMAQLREKLGKQDIDVYGIDPRTRAGLVLIEADYRMKLVGMGLEEGVPGVPSYLSMVQVPAGQAPPPMDVLRWWFTLKYDGILASADHNAFQLQGQGLQVLSENEMLTATGQRVHTGNSDELNRAFAQNFTTHFRELAAKYPVYAELENLADLSIVAALVRREELAEKTRWHMLFFKDKNQYQPRLAGNPKRVETVINHRDINGVGVLVGVSGGVRIDPTALVRPDAIKRDETGDLKAKQTEAAAKDAPREHWWWD